MAVKFTRVDLNFILTRINMAQAGQSPVNPLLAFGLWQVAGTGNNLVPAQGGDGATDQTFPTTTDQLLQNAQAGITHGSTGGLVTDAEPRMIGNLISGQTTNNPAALAAQARPFSFLGAGYQNTSTQGADGILSATTAHTATAGADGVYGTAVDVVTEFGKDGAPGTANDVTGPRGGLLHNLPAGADDVFGVIAAYSVTSNGEDDLLAPPMTLWTSSARTASSTATSPTATTSSARAAVCSIRSRPVRTGHWATRMAS